jgi:hypothetical protein
MKLNKYMMIGGLLLTFGYGLLSSFVFMFLSVYFGADQINEYVLQSSDHQFVFIVVIIASTLPFFIGAFLLVGAFLYPLIKHSKAKNKILENGISAEAKILAISEGGMRINGNPVVNLSLEINSPTQAAFRAEVSQVVSIVNLPSFQPGKLLDVKYLPGTNQVAVVGTKLS